MNASIKRNGLLTLGAVVIAVVSYQAGKSSYSEPEKDLSTSPDPNHFRLRLDARDQASKRWHRQEELKAAFFETRRPFNWDPRPYSFWKILTDCQLPDPAKSAYRECLLVVEAQQVNLANSLTLDSGAGQVVRMVLPGFAERRPKTGAILKKGSIFQCQTFSPEELPEGIFSSQTVDTTESFDLKTLVAMAAHRCESAPQPYIAPVAFETASGISREEVIRNDYNTFKSWLQTRGGNLDAIIKEKAALVPRIKTELENSGGILTRGHLSFTRLPEGSKVSQGWDEQPFSALFSFHKQLAARGIDLIVCPIPEKELLVGPKFFDDPLIDARRYQLYEKLWEAGIEAIDLLPTLQERSGEFQWMMYDGLDQHPADGVIRVTADKLAERLSRYNFVSAADRRYQAFTLCFGLHGTDDNFPESAFLPAAYTATQVLRPNGQPISMFDPARKTSRILLVGDCFTMWPLDFGVDGCDLLAQITLRVGAEPQRLFAGGGGPEMLKLLAARPEMITGKKVVVLCFAERFFFQGRWPDAKIP